MTDLLNVTKLATDLSTDEGKRKKPYKDTVGKLSIGIGRNLEDVGLSEDEMQYLLKNDIARAVALLDKHVPWWRTLSEARQRVLANMMFNMGWDNPATEKREGLSGFVNTLALIKSGQYAKAADEMLKSKWAAQVGDRAKRLAAMMRSGV